MATCKPSTPHPRDARADLKDSPKQKIHPRSNHLRISPYLAAKKTFGWLVRNIVGLDAQAARAAFADFIHRGNLKPAQMTFLELIIRHLTQHGVLDKAVLGEPPFTDVHDQGVFGLFGEADVVGLIAVIDGVNGNAVA